MAGKLIMLKGLPASGKSTWAKEAVFRSSMSADSTADWWVRVNKDDIRAGLNQPWSRQLEEEAVIGIRDMQIIANLKLGKTVICDDTNLAPKHERRLRDVAASEAATFEVDDSFLNTDLDTCIRRDSFREGSAKVGEKVIREMAETYLEPAKLIKRPGQPHYGKQLFLDLDGVFADFDSFIYELFGFERNRTEEPDNFWDTIRTYPGRLYYDMAPLPYAKRLFAVLKEFHPVILTGCPWSIPTAADDKREWVAKHLSPDVQMVCCKSRNKSRYALPGDILLDDWTKYRDLWTANGGVFLHHTDPDDSIKQVKEALGV